MSDANSASDRRPEPERAGDAVPLFVAAAESVSDRSYPATIREARPCLACGYSLQGLSIADRCPECGAPVVRSLRGGLLRYASREYVTTVCRGVALAEVAILARMPLLLMRVGIFAAVLPWIGMMRALAGVGLAVFSALAMWMLSTADPGYADEELARERWWVRAVAIVGVGQAMMEVFPLPGWKQSIGFLGMTRGDVVYVLIGFGVVMMEIVVVMRLMSMIAARGPEMELRGSLRRFRYEGPMWYAAGLWLCGVGPFVSMILYATLLDRVRAMLKETLRVMDAERGGGE